MNHIVTKAREYLGTPWMHQGRVKHHGVDCVGLLVCVCRELGVVAPDWDVKGYSRIPDGKELMRHLHENLAYIERSDMVPGSVVCVAFDKHPQHVGIVGDYIHGGLSLIHADSRAGRVVEHRLLLGSTMRYVSAFKVK
jgi:cell wall-associated NlpC family hydrolase